MRMYHQSVSAQEPRLMGLEEAAGYLGLDPRSVLRLMDRGLLKPVRIEGLRRVLLDRRDLDRLVDLSKGQNVVEVGGIR
jgi:excisionase family DNA binding protein